MRYIYWFFSAIYLGFRIALELAKMEREKREEDCNNYLDTEGRQTDPGEEREHIDGPDCWCKPTLFFDGGDEFGNVWVHKANGDELPPASILASAVADAISEHGNNK